MTLLEVDASVVHAGWLPLFLTGLLLVALAVIFFSMRKHLRIADTFPSEAQVRQERRAEKTEPVDTGE